jgi:hypothetical protein
VRLRRTGLFVLAGVGAAALASAVGLVLAAPGSRDHGSTKAVYLAQASAICQQYGRKLDNIPPVQDPTLLGNVLASVNAALPILRQQAARIHELTPPAELRANVARFFVLTDRSISTLASVRTAALNMNVGDVGIGLERFGRETIAAKRVARRIGYRC